MQKKNVFSVFSTFLVLALSRKYKVFANCLILKEEIDGKFDVNWKKKGRQI